VELVYYYLDDHHNLFIFIIKFIFIFIIKFIFIFIIKFIFIFIIKFIFIFIIKFIKKDNNPVGKYPNFTDIGEITSLTNRKLNDNIELNSLSKSNENTPTLLVYHMILIQLLN
jgi:hypothetical protein